MEGQYPITSSGKNIGQVQIVRKGLYYHFFCQCSYDASSVCRLMMRCGDQTQKLGVMVPEGIFFVLKKQIPVKNIPKEKPEFFLLSEIENQETGIFVPISPDEPFEYLACLKNAVFENRDGIIGVWIPDIE